ncbi:MAG: Mrp/NBP35 family ATP-binding protein [Rhodobacteraceae bacterium]|nr:Mrp/NBP35 family ATP-binding protein [Paracoccaceae bacterium]
MTDAPPILTNVQQIPVAEEPCERLNGCDICPEFHGCMLKRRETHESWLVGEKLKKIKHRLIITSGKGGVGKSTLTAGIAVALAKAGLRVALIDADIHGPNIPQMLVAPDSEAAKHQKGLQLDDIGIVPIVPMPDEAPGLGMISMDYFIESSDDAVMWKGPLKKDLIRQLVAAVNWGERDVLLFDLPPGTGDEPMMVTEIVDRIDGAVVVSTPQRVALLDARKSISMAGHLNVPVLGMVENMTDEDLFGADQVKKSADELNVPYLGNIPLDRRIIRLADEGRSIIIEHPESKAAEAITALTERIIGDLEK